jgi:hypothetical protein
MACLEVGASMLTVPFELGHWDSVVEKAEDVAVPIGSYTLDSGEKFVVLTVSLTNAGMRAAQFNPSLVLAKVTDEDGADVQYVNTLKMSAPDVFSGTVDPGNSIRLRFVFKGPLLAKAARVALKEYFSERTVVVKLEKPN